MLCFVYEFFPSRNEPVAAIFSLSLYNNQAKLLHLHRARTMQWQTHLNKWLANEWKREGGKHQLRHLSSWQPAALLVSSGHAEAIITQDWPTMILPYNIFSLDQNQTKTDQSKVRHTLALILICK